MLNMPTTIFFGEHGKGITWPIQPYKAESYYICLIEDTSIQERNPRRMSWFTKFTTKSFNTKLHNSLKLYGVVHKE